MCFLVGCSTPGPAPVAPQNTALPIPLTASRTSQAASAFSEPPLPMAEDAGLPHTACALDSTRGVAPAGPPATFRDFTSALAQLLDQLDTTNLNEAFRQFAKSRNLDPDTPGLSKDYVRLRVLFEAARDGGYWRLRWDITNREPSATLIWRAWQREPVDETFGHALATAECDELSSLYSLLARRIGVDRVGLFYPTWNHTIAAWAIKSGPRQRQRLVLVPTTQIFLPCEESFDTSGFKTGLTNIEPYPRWDIRDNSPLPVGVAQFLLQQVRVYAPASLELQALLRARRALELKSSMGNCIEFRQQLGQRLKGRLSCADHRALRHFASSELNREHLSDDELLGFLSSSVREPPD